MKPKTTTPKPLQNHSKTIVLECSKTSYSKTPYIYRGVVGVVAGLEPAMRRAFWFWSAFLNMPVRTRNIIAKIPTLTPCRQHPINSTPITLTN